MKTLLTKKEELAIEYHLQGDNKSQAILKAYDCKDIKSAYAIATKVFKKPEVQARLNNKLAVMDERTLETRQRFTDLVEKYISRPEIAKKLAEVMLSNDRRAFLDGLGKYLQLTGELNEAKNIGVLTLVQKITRDNEKGEDEDYVDKEYNREFAG